MESKIAQAALFMSPEPLTLDQLTKVMGLNAYGKSLGIMDDVVKNFNENNDALEIIKTQDHRYRMQVKTDVLPRVQHLAVTTDLSKAVLRTLAIVAFKQPIRQSIVIKVRGNKAYEHIEKLVEEGFVKKVKESNTYSLETTKKFEEYFGPPIKDTEFVLTKRGEQLRLTDAGPDDTFDFGNPHDLE